MAVCYLRDISDIQDECLVVVTPRFCGVNPKHKDVLDELERECLRVRAMETQEAPEPDQTIAPRNPAGRKGKESGDEKKDVTRLNGTRGNSSEYRITRLKRDHMLSAPEIASSSVSQSPCRMSSPSLPSR